jgi:epoxide hydrolase
MSDVLGYARFGAHGGDIGAMVANRLALEYPDRLVGIHVTRPADPYVGPGAAPLTLGEQSLLAARARWHAIEGGYVHLQRILEKWRPGATVMARAGVAMRGGRRPVRR